MSTVTAGLDGVVVAQTSLSSVNGTEGILKFRGYDINDFANQAAYEEVAFLLWYGSLPTQAELAGLRARLGEHRAMPEPVSRAVQGLPSGGAPIDSLKIGTTVLGMLDPDADNWEHEALIEKALRTTAMFPTVLAAYQRLRNGQELIEPLPDLDTAGNLLYMVTGERPSQVKHDAFNCYLTLLVEHSMNASTFTARSTLSSTTDYYSAITSALGSLKGIAHGGANMMAMEMLLEIGDPDNIDDFIDESLRTKRRLMGMGHRIYKTRDPRVNHLMYWSERVAEEVGDTKWHQLAHRMEELTNHHPYFTERGLYPNVEFYSAPLLYNLGFPTDLMPGVFAVSRVAGWSAHLLEQAENNRLMRPQAEYVGPAHQEWVPIERRG